MSTPKVVFAPDATEQLKEGFDQMAKLLTSTLGPSRGIVLSTKELADPPEVLNDAATIARRVVQIPDRRQDVGAMILRQMVWRMNQRIGDGAATTAVLAKALFDAVYRVITAGASMVDVQSGMLAAADIAADRLRQLSRPAADWETLSTVGYASTGHRQLADILGELIEILGPDNHITIEDYMSPVLERTYLDGGRWKGKLPSPYLITAPASQKAILNQVHVVAVADRLLDPNDLFGVLTLVQNAPSSNLLIVAYEFSEEVQKALVGTHNNPQNNIQVTAFRSLRGGEHGRKELEDLIMLTGGRVLSSETGQPLSKIQAEDMGFAVRTEATRDSVLIQQGQGDREALAEYTAKLRSYLDIVGFTDDEYDHLKERIARLKEATAILKIGTHSKTERSFLHKIAEQGIKTVSSAAHGGVVPGGGTSFLHAMSAVADFAASCEEDAADYRSGVMCLHAMLEAPFQTLLRNRGLEVPEIKQSEVMALAPGAVYDVMAGQILSAESSGLLDATDVLLAALETAVGGVSMAMSVETLVLNKNPELSYQP